MPSPSKHAASMSCSASRGHGNRPRTSPRSTPSVLASKARSLRGSARRPAPGTLSRAAQDPSAGRGDRGSYESQSPAPLARRRRTNHHAAFTLRTISRRLICIYQQYQFCSQRAPSNTVRGSFDHDAVPFSHRAKRLVQRRGCSCVGLRSENLEEQGVIVDGMSLSPSVAETVNRFVVVVPSTARATSSSACGQ